MNPAASWIRQPGRRQGSPPITGGRLSPSGSVPVRPTLPHAPPRSPSSCSSCSSQAANAPPPWPPPAHALGGRRGAAGRWRARPSLHRRTALGLLGRMTCRRAHGRVQRRGLGAGEAQLVDREEPSACLGDAPAHPVTAGAFVRLVVTERAIHPRAEAAGLSGPFAVISPTVWWAT